MKPMPTSEKVTVNQHTKNVTTELNDIIYTDVIKVTDNLSKNMFQGAQYFGMHSKHKRLWDGHVRTYVQLPTSRNPLLLTKKEIQKRVHFIEDIADNISSGQSSLYSELLYSELVNLNKKVFTEIYDISIVKLSAKDAVTMQSLLRLPTNKMRNLRVCLNNLKMNILPPERKMNKERYSLANHMKEVETGFIGLRRTKNEVNVSSNPYLRVQDIVEFIEEIIQKDNYGFNFDGAFQNVWWLLFSGDKGARLMKYYVEIINSLNAGSVDNVHVYSMFEAQDTVENMMKVWYPVYHDQIKQLQQSSFTLKDGRAVEMFLGGDYHFLDDNMGHQGSSATYPSSLDTILVCYIPHKRVLLN